MLLLITALVIGDASESAEYLRALEQAPVGVVFAEAPSLHAAGETFKVAFDEFGASYQPFLGSNAPSGVALTLRLESVRCGEQQLLLDGDVLPQREGARITYDRCLVQEHFDLDSRSLSQSFLIESVTEPGPLALRVSYDSELVATVDGDAILFLGEHGGVRYGAATVFDARGRSSAAPLALLDGAIEIRVDESFVAAAEFPLLIDPLVTTLAIDSSNFEDCLPDVAYDSSLDVYVVVWQRRFSANDHDIMGRVVAADGTLLAPFAVDMTATNTKQPKIAGIEALDRFLVTSLDGASFPSVIHSRVVDLVGPLSVGPAVQHFHAIQHDLGGDATQVQPYGFCLTGTQTQIGLPFIRWQLLDANGLPGASFVGSSSDDWDENLRVAKSAHIAPGGAKRWAATWEFYDITPPARISFGELDFNSLTHPFGLENLLRVSAPAGNDTSHAQSVSTRLDAADGSGTHMVVWTRLNPLGVLEYHGRVVSSGGLQTADLDLGGNPLANFPNVVVDADGSNFVVAYSEHDLGGLNRLRVATYDAIGTDLGLSEQLDLSGADGAERHPAIVSTRSGGGAPQRFFVVWDEVLGAQGNIQAALYDSPGPGTPYCSGLPNSVGAGAQLSASGSQSLALNSFQLHVEGSVPNQPGVFFLGLTELAVPFGEGLRCAGNPTWRFGPPVTADAAGAASFAPDFTQPLGGLVSPGPTLVRYQYWYRDPSGGPAGFNLTSALRVQHLP